MIDPQPMNETEQLLDTLQTALVDELNLLTETIEELLQQRASMVALCVSLNEHLPEDQRLNGEDQFPALIDPIHAGEDDQ